jgi:hypothetical protein
MNDIQPTRAYFPVTHSILSTAALLAQVLPDYSIVNPTECKLLGCGVNDTYLVKTSAVPWFVAARHIWLLGLHTANSPDWGCGWMNDDYFDNGGAGGLEFLREWDSEHLQAAV